MNFNFGLLSQNVLFKNIPIEKIDSILNCAYCNIETFDAKVNICEIGESITSTAIILNGVVDIIQTSANGDETIIDRLTEGDIFGNSLSSFSNMENSSYVRAEKKSTVLFVDINQVLKNCHFICDYKTCLFENIINSLTKNNIILNSKIQIMSQKTLRNKIMTYFEMLSMKKGSKEITIPFNREQLACYLGSERSSVCRELTKLKEKNIIDIDKNKVVLLK